MTDLQLYEFYIGLIKARTERLKYLLNSYNKLNNGSKRLFTEWRKSRLRKAFLEEIDIIDSLYKKADMARNTLK